MEMASVAYSFSPAWLPFAIRVLFQSFKELIISSVTNDSSTVKISCSDRAPPTKGPINKGEPGKTH